jgi:3-phenylpropionate/trans-cinnamate dioxygenase ferredoxin subunit
MIILLVGAIIGGKEGHVALFNLSGLKSELTDGQMKMVMVGDKEILLAHVGNKVYATQNRCPHMGGNLSHGTLNGTVVTCPRHGSQYDVRDGRVLRWTNWPKMVLFFARLIKSPRPLKTYPVTIETGDIFIDI